MTSLIDSPGRGEAHQILERAFELLPELGELRRRFHRRPELGFAETETAAAVQSALRRYVPDLVAVCVGRTGLLVHRAGVHPTVLLRACLDALPIDDPKDVDYASSVPGVCHACGHDAQIAEVIGAFAILAGRDPQAPVAALFQPAEEIDQGALAVLGDPAFQTCAPVHAMIGIHGHPGLDAGFFAIRPGPVMACITTLSCTVVGQGGHGAEPHRGPDAVTAAASLVVDWQVALARRVDRRMPVVFSVGRITGGTTSNVIPGRVDIEGTLRYLDPALRPCLEGVLEGVARGVEARFGVDVQVELQEVVPALVNDAGLVRLVAEAAAGVVGAGRLGEVEPSLGGDDFARYCQLYPGCYIFVGERQPGRSAYGWHDPSYDIDEQSIAYAAAVLAASALAVAKGGPLA
jgi:amidohydrolase